MVEEGRIKQEEWPLQGSYVQSRPYRFKGPLRVVKLCVLGIAIPSALISIPLYMRYRVYVDQLYPFSVSDMRLLDGRISTFWCQRQLVKVNATFNAYLMPEPPAVLPEPKPVSMTRELLLEDDMKEYWGFYLLRGSSVTVSTCVRWPGASLIVIRGHKHLHECAYIGDDSSEELEELLRIAKENLFGKSNTSGTDSSSSSSNSVPNAPHIMTRLRPDISLQYPLTNKVAYNHTNDIQRQMDTSSDITDPELMRSILNIISEKTSKQKKRLQQDLAHKYKEQNDINIKRIKNITSSEELYQEIAQKLDGAGGKQHKIMERLNQRLNRTKRELIIETARVLNEHDEARNAALEESDGIADVRGTVNETTDNDRSNSEFWSSFSSSEEILLNCEGLILNLPLSPHHNCVANHSDEKFFDAAQSNTVTYRVPSNGYYFFVFNSENEVQLNYVRVRFYLNKTIYNVSYPVETCSNTTDACTLDLRFLSNEKTILELPLNPNETRWNDEFIVISECEPRTAVYVCCVLAVPILILFFAFQ